LGRLCIKGTGWISRAINGGTGRISPLNGSLSTGARRHHLNDACRYGDTRSGDRASGCAKLGLIAGG
jgi:hypothetical protein